MRPKTKKKAFLQLMERKNRKLAKKYGDVELVPVFYKPYVPTKPSEMHYSTFHQKNIGIELRIGGIKYTAGNRRLSIGDIVSNSGKTLNENFELWMDGMSRMAESHPLVLLYKLGL
jgi:hypothetical protein